MCPCRLGPVGQHVACGQRQEAALEPPSLWTDGHGWPQLQRCPQDFTGVLSSGGVRGEVSCHAHFLWAWSHAHPRHRATHTRTHSTRATHTHGSVPRTPTAPCHAHPHPRHACHAHPRHTCHAHPRLHATHTPSTVPRTLPYTSHMLTHTTHKAFFRNKDLKQFGECFISVVGARVREMLVFVFDFPNKK